MTTQELEQLMVDLQGIMDALETRVMPEPEYVLVGPDGSAVVLLPTRQACLEYAMLHGIRGFQIEELWV